MTEPSHRLRAMWKRRPAEPLGGGDGGGPGKGRASYRSWLGGTPSLECSLFAKLNLATQIGGEVELRTRARQRVLRLSLRCSGFVMPLGARLTGKVLVAGKERAELLCFAGGCFGGLVFGISRRTYPELPGLAPIRSVSTRASQFPPQPSFPFLHLDQLGLSRIT